MDQLRERNDRLTVELAEHIQTWIGIEVDDVIGALASTMSAVIVACKHGEDRKKLALRAIAHMAAIALQHDDDARPAQH